MRLVWSSIHHCGGVRRILLVLALLASSFAAPTQVRADVRFFDTPQGALDRCHSAYPGRPADVVRQDRAYDTVWSKAHPGLYRYQIRHFYITRSDPRFNDPLFEGSYMCKPEAESETSPYNGRNYKTYFDRSDPTAADVSNAPPPDAPQSTRPVSESTYEAAVRACSARYHDSADALVVRIDRLDSSPGSPFYQPGQTVFYQASRTPANDQSAMAPNEPYTCRGDLPQPAINITTLVKRTLFSPSGIRKFERLDQARAYCAQYWKQDDPTVLALVANPPPLPAGKTAAYATEFGTSSQYFAAGTGRLYECKAEVVALLPNSWIDVDQIGGAKLAVASAGPASSYDLFRQANCPTDTVVDQLRDTVPALGTTFTVYLKKGDRGFNESNPNGRWVCLRNISGPTTADIFDLADRQTAQNARVAQEQQEIQHPTRISKKSPADFDIEHLIGYCAQRYRGHNVDIVRQVDAAGYVTHTSTQYALSAPAGGYGDLVCAAEATSLGWANRDATYARQAANDQAAAAAAAAAVPKKTIVSCASTANTQGVNSVFSGAVSFETASTIYFCNAKDISYKADKSGYVIGLQVQSIGMFPLVASGGGNLVASGGGNLVASGGGNLVASGGGNLVASGGGNITIRDVNGSPLVAAGAGNLVASGGGNLVASGGGNLVASGGGNLFSSLAALVASGGGNFVKSNGLLAGSDAIARLVAQGGGNIMAQSSGSGLIGQDGGGLLAGGTNGLISSNASSETFKDAASLQNQALAALAAGSPLVGNSGGTADGSGFRIMAFSNDSGPATRFYKPAEIVGALTACDHSTSALMIGRNTVFAFPGSHQYVRIPETNDPKQLPTVIGQIANMTKSASFMFGCRADLSAAGWTQYSGPWPPPQPAAPAAAPRPPAAGTSPGITVHRLAPSGYYLVAGQEAWQFTPEQVSAATAPSSGVPTSFTIGGSTFYLAFSGNDAAVQVNGARVTAMGFGTIAGDVASAPRSDVLPRSVLPVSTLCRFAGAAIRKAQQTTGAQPGVPCAASAPTMAQPIAAAVPPQPANGLPTIKVVHADATPATGIYMIDSTGEAWVFQKSDVAARLKPDGTLAGFTVKTSMFDVVIGGPMAKIMHNGATILAAGSGTLTGAPGAYKIDGRNIAGPTGDIPVQIVVQFFAAKR